ncbi:hypothetical protein ABK040_007541 [Willaertia magna]
MGDHIQKDFVQVISNLQNHWNVLEEELIEINKDIQYLNHCLKKYGESFRIPLEYLKDLKVYKKNAMKEIISTMENFTSNLNGGRLLVHNLNKHLATSELPSKDLKSTLQTGNELLQQMIAKGDVVNITTKSKPNTPVHYKLITKKPTNNGSSYNNGSTTVSTSLQRSDSSITKSV